MLTTAFVANEHETRQMLAAGAGRYLRASQLDARRFSRCEKIYLNRRRLQVREKIFQLVQKIKPEVLRMIYAGPANSLADMKYLFHKTDCQGYIGGSTFDRIPIERAIFDTVKIFKRGSKTAEESSSLTRKISTEFLFINTV